MNVISLQVRRNVRVVVMTICYFLAIEQNFKRSVISSCDGCLQFDGQKFPVDLSLVDVQRIVTVWDPSTPLFLLLLDLFIPSSTKKC